jgi:hypothetical protein
MNIATAKLNLSSLDGEQEQDEDEGFNDVIDKEDSINLLSDNEGGEDLLKEDLSAHHKDLTFFGNNYDTSSKVSSGVFDAVHSNKLEESDNFKKLTWNKAGPSSGSMIILLGLLKDELEANQAGLPAKFNRVPTKLLEFLCRNQGRTTKIKLSTSKKSCRSLSKLVKLIPATRLLASPREWVNQKPVRLKECYPKPTRQAPQRTLQSSLPPWQDRTRRELTSQTLI